MALDPSIILQAGRGVTPLESPMDAMGKALALKNQFQQGQIQNMQMQQQQAAMQRENEFRQGLQQTGNDPQKIQDLLTRTGKFKEAAEYSKSLKDAEAAKVGLQNEYLKLGQNERATLQDMVGSVGAAAAAVSKIPDPALKWQKWQETLPQLAMQFAPTETDTPRMREIKANRIALMQQESQRLMAMQAPQDLDNILAEHLNDAKTKVDWLKEAEQEREAGRFGGFHPAIGEDGKPGIFQSNKAGAVRQVPGLKPVPSAAAVVNVGLGGGGNGKIDDEYLNSLDPVTRDTIIKIGQGKYGSLDALKRTKGGQAKIDAFVRAGGSVSDVNNAVKFQEDMKKTNPGSVGGTYLSVNKSAEHLQRALDNLNQFPAEDPSTPYWVQRAKNLAWTVQNPGTASPLEKNWHIITGALLDETEKNILGGKPSVDQARAIEKLKTMPFTATKAEKLAAMQAVIDLTMGQYDAVEQMRKQAQGKFAKEDSMLSPKSQKTLETFNRMLGREGEAPAPQTPARTTLDAASPMSTQPGPRTILRVSPQEAAKLPKGTRFIGLDGVERVKN